MICVVIALICSGLCAGGAWAWFMTEDPITLHDGSGVSGTLTFPGLPPCCSWYQNGSDSVLAMSDAGSADWSSGAYVRFFPIINASSISYSLGSDTDGNLNCIDKLTDGSTPPCVFFVLPETMGAGDSLTVRAAGYFEVLPATASLDRWGIDSITTDEQSENDQLTDLVDDNAPPDDSLQPGDGTQLGDGAQPGGNTQLGDGAQPGDGDQPGDGTQLGDGDQPGGNTQLGDGDQPGDGTQLGDGTQPGGNTQLDGAQPGGNTQLGDSTQPGDGA